MKDRFFAFIKDPKNKWLLLGFLALGVLALFVSLHDSNDKPVASEEPAFSADTIIPKGFVLVPVEIQNIEALQSLVGSFAIVDLFTTAQPPHQKSGQRVGQHLRLLRAPLNPQTFAVLVPESEASELLAAAGPFVAVIQNPASKAPSSINKKKITISNVEYFHGGRHD